MKPNGTNSVKPPVRDWMSRSRSIWLTQCSGVSRWPYIMVEVLRMPHSCAVSMISHHCAVVSLLRESTMAHGVVENFGGGAGQRVEAVVFQHQKVVPNGHAGEFDAVQDFHRREGVHVHRWARRLSPRAGHRDSTTAAELRGSPP